MTISADLASGPEDTMPTSGTVALFSLGGTIAMTRESPHSGVVPALSAAQLLAAVPGLRESGITLRVHDFRALPGASLSFDDLTALATAVAGELADGADGIVITQGTDTIEETAFLLDLLHHGEQPVVVTGAMRHPAEPGADGPGNLRAAVVAAADPRLRGLGCVVVLNDEIHAARRVAKTHSLSTAAFASPGWGPLGRLVEGRFQLTARPAEHRLRVPEGGLPGRPVRVGVHTATFGEDPALLSALGGHCDGLVVAAFGAGHVSESLVAPLERLAVSVPVVLSTRIGNGPVLRGTYGFPGSERDLRARGLTGSGDLGPYKARLLLHLLLAQGRSRREVTEVFAALDG